ncbi:glycosyltransferase [Halorubrum amylolyticum]|uniref:glycosyltransferase n=1 Tax=Halorubrum amylolyticum TaxID=2508724 RepID=UPI001008E817|nr:glycosyltransferase [Halorubrum amylolyticum]
MSDVNSGVLYVATGADFVNEAKISAKQLKEVMPEVDVTVFSDRQVNSPHFDSTVHIDSPTYSFLDKVKSIRRSPYQKTLYLDTDIYVNEPVYELFDVLDHFDMAAAIDAHQQSVIPNDEYAAPEIYTGEYDPVPEFNCGLISFRNNPRVRECFEAWESKYNTTTDWADQPSLMHAFQHSDVRYCPLPPRYNYIPGLRNSVSGIVKIFHNRLNSGMEMGYKDAPPQQLPQVIERVNQTPEARVTYPYLGKIEDYTDLEVFTEDPVLRQVLKSFWRLGPSKAAKFWVRKLREATTGG